MLAEGDTLKTGKSFPGLTINADVTVSGGKTPFVIFVKNKAGESKRTIVKKWIGKDVPLQPEGIKLTLDTKSKVTLTWTAPTKGKNGGYVNPSDLRYKIVRYQMKLLLQIRTLALLSQKKLPPRH